MELLLCSTTRTKVGSRFVSSTGRTGRLPTRDIDGGQAGSHLNDLYRIQGTKRMRVTADLVESREQTPQLVRLLRGEGNTWSLSLTSSTSLMGGAQGRNVHGYMSSNGEERSKSNKE